MIILWIVLDIKKSNRIAHRLFKLSKGVLCYRASIKNLSEVTMTRSRQDILKSPEYKAFESASIGTAGSGFVLGAISSMSPTQVGVAAGFIGFGYANMKLGFFERSNPHYTEINYARCVGIALTVGIYGFIQSVIQESPAAGMLIAGLLVLAAARLLTHLPESIGIQNQHSFRPT